MAGDDSSCPVVDAAETDARRVTEQLLAAQLRATGALLAARERDCVAALMGVLECAGDAEEAFAELDESPDGRAFTEAMRRIGEHARTAIVSLQFVDEVRQRIDHSVADAEDMTRLTGAAGDSSVLARIRERYTTLEEREVFDAVVSGARPSPVA